MTISYEDGAEAARQTRERQAALVDQLLAVPKDANGSLIAMGHPRPPADEPEQPPANAESTVPEQPRGMQVNPAQGAGAIAVPPEARPRSIADRIREAATTGSTVDLTGASR